VHDEMNKVGAKLKAAREGKGMTQTELARATDLATRTIMDIENGKHYPAYEVFFKLVRALDMSANHIFWPDRESISQEQEQLMRAVGSCTEHEKLIFMESAWAFVRAAKSDGNPK
jgi:putative transcriptional regulator